VSCWGEFRLGQIGNGRIESSQTNCCEWSVRNRQNAVVGLIDVESIALGEDHSCAVLSSGAVKCWGLATQGRLGCGQYLVRNSAKIPDQGCAINMTYYYDVVSPIPVDVVGLNSGVAVVAVASDKSCAVLRSGRVKCWGSNVNTPQDVVGLESGVLDITLGSSHSCVLLSSGGVKCWGMNNYGQVGDNTTTSPRSSPVSVVSLGSGVASVASGGSHSCAILSSGGVKCWGYNGNGELGDGTTTHRRIPVSVVGLDSGVASIVSGYVHSCVLLSSGEVKCWGSTGSYSGYPGQYIVSLTPIAVRLKRT
jgi:alpha-tubulin suppressor-like RCC1 family protein